MLRRKLFAQSIDNNVESEEVHDTPNSSKYFQKDISDEFLAIEKRLNDDLRQIQFISPVKYVYNPIEYAYKPHELFVKKYCKNMKKILFLGMNPGPFGMCQTGVPFGEIKTVKEWFQIQCEVEKPQIECPARPITGFLTKRSEISGKRFWGLFKSKCEHPENFFRFAYLHNYCPLAFMNENGKNLTPQEIKGPEIKLLEQYCDQALIDLVQLIKADIVIGIGTYVTNKVTKVFKKAGLDVNVIYMPHPSPRALHNNNWEETGANFLESNHLMQFFTTKNWMIN